MAPVCVHVQTSPAARRLRLQKRAESVLMQQQNLRSPSEGLGVEVGGAKRRAHRHRRPKPPEPPPYLTGCSKQP